MQVVGGMPNIKHKNLISILLVTNSKYKPSLPLLSNASGRPRFFPDAITSSRGYKARSSSLKANLLNPVTERKELWSAFLNNWIHGDREGWTRAELVNRYRFLELFTVTTINKIKSNDNTSLLTSLRVKRHNQVDN